MRVELLLENIAPVQVVNLLPSWLELTGVTDDSRKVHPGVLFVAIPGVKGDGAGFVRDAQARGAAAVLTEHREPLSSLPQLVVPDARIALGRAARAFHGHPDRCLRLAAVTGTNGKSTTAYLVRHLMRSCGVPCGMLGTVEYDLGGGILAAPLTTPGAADLFAYLRAMVDSGCHAAIMETSSHSLHQHRVEGLDFAAAAFTNLTRDHLDYHKKMENYLDAKAILFRGLKPNALAVLNLDDPKSEYLASQTRAQVLSYSLHPASRAELRACVVRMDLHQTVFTVRSPWGTREVRWHMAGIHNVQNALAALGLTMGLDHGERETFNFDHTLSALERFTGVPGRLERVGDEQAPFSVFVDYAHTDDALTNVLGALRALKPRRLLVVFGCGGDRDRTKRPLMAKAVEEKSDFAIVTSDNPRTEDPLAIIEEIKAGITQPAKFEIEPDRGRAIARVIALAAPGDIVLLAGKGHEDYQIVGTEKRHFDDRQEARLALEHRFGHAAVKPAAAGL